MLIKAIKSSNSQVSQTYDFDHILGEQSSQADVYVELKDLIFSIFEGHDASVFAYGNTGTGKTYTIFGGDKPADQGLIPRALKEIQERMSTSSKMKFIVSYGFFELYLDKLYNLLDEHRSTETQTLKLTKLKDTKDIVTSLLGLMRSAKRRRATAKTSVNNYSSRSHAFFLFKIISVEDTGSEIIERMGTLTFADLAGSEKLTEVDVQKKKENLFINKSLTSLRDVLIALANKEQHVPYRNSKLTSLLQPFLGQNARTFIVVNVSSNPKYYFQTKSSLDFAKAIPRIKYEMGFKRNVVVTPKLLWTKEAFGDEYEDERVLDAKEMKPPEFSKIFEENDFE